MRYRELVDHAQALRPIVRTRYAVECRHCSQVIGVTHVYFTDPDDPDSAGPWCRMCAVSIMLSLYVIDTDTALAVPFYGPLPDWMMRGSPLSWTLPGPLPT